MGLKTTIRTYALALMSLAMATFLLIHFALIWVYGKYYIYESNLLVLLLETIVMSVMLCFSFFCIVEQLQQKK